MQICFFVLVDSRLLENLIQCDREAPFLPHFLKYYDQSLQQLPLCSYLSAVHLALDPPYAQILRVICLQKTNDLIYVMNSPRQRHAILSNGRSGRDIYLHDDCDDITLIHITPSNIT